MRWLPAALLALLPCSLLSQMPLGSTVTGHVICGDTNGPARFAKVLLKSTAPSHLGEDFMKSMTDSIKKAQAAKGEKAPGLTPEQTRVQAAAAANMNRVTDMLNSSTVAMDGAYRFVGVQPGTYYVHVMLAGYIDPLSQFSDEELASTDPKIKARLAAIPTVTVNGSDEARMDLKIDRGAAVSGRVLFDDGSPAAGWTMSAVKPDGEEDGIDASTMMMSQALALSGSGQVFRTDDLGRFRISGLPSGSYVLRATLVTSPVGVSASNLAESGGGIALTVYTGDTFRKKTAKTVTLQAGDEHIGADMTIKARSLHTIVGHVASKADGHVLNMGSVVLTSKSNPALHLKAAIRADGSFHFEYLPGGVTYTMSVDDAADGKATSTKANLLGITIPNTEALHKYAPASQELALGDADVESVQFSLTMTDWTPPVPKKREKPEDLFDTP